MQAQYLCPKRIADTLMRHFRPQSVSEMGNCLFQLASTLIFISVIQPIFLAGAVPLMVIYYFIQKVNTLLIVIVP